MTLWFVFALMTVAAIFAVLWPLSRGGRPQNDGSEAAVYRDQLAEVDRDVAAGLIGASEAEAARVEISRRLLAAADSQRRSACRIEHRGCAVRRPCLALVGLADHGGRASICRSARRGSAIFRWPSARARPMPAQPLDNMVAQVEAHLEKNPTDGRGWNVLAPVLAQLGRFDDAVRGLSQFDHLQWRQRRAPRRSRRGAGGRGGRRRHGGGQGRIRARRRAERGRGQGELFPRAGRRAGRPRSRGRLDLARDAGKGAAGCAVASAGPGRTGAGRRRAAAPGAVRMRRSPRPRT